MKVWVKAVLLNIVMAVLYVIADMFAWNSLLSSKVGYDYSTGYYFLFIANTNGQFNNAILNTPLLVIVATIILNIFLVWHVENKKNIRLPPPP